MKFLRGALAFFLCLLLLSFASRDKAEPTAANPEFDQAPLADRDFVFYTVQPGDTLQGVTRRFRVMSEDQILALNPHLDADKLPVNERIKIPLE
jgi:hypothetical protein